MQKILADIQNQSYHKAYLFYGAERYMVKDYRDRLKKALVGDTQGVNYSCYTGTSFDEREAKEMINTLPFFADYRLVVFEDTGLFKKKNDFAEVLSAAPQSSVVLFAEKEIDRRNTLYKYLQKNGLVTELDAPDEAEAMNFVAGKLSQTGLKIKTDTAKYFLSQVENSYYTIENEMNKLIAYADGKEEITCADVDDICHAQVSGQIFLLIDALSQKETDKAFALYSDLLLLRESPMSVLSLLSRHFRILLQIKAIGNARSKDALAKAVGVPPFSVNKYRRQCQSFSLQTLKQNLTDCVQTEFDIKQGKMAEQTAVETLLVRLLAPCLDKSESAR